MTIDEIELLTIDIVRTELTTIVLNKYGDQINNRPELIDELISNEFPVYIKSLIAEERARVNALEIESARLEKELEDAKELEIQNHRVSLRGRLDLIENIEESFMSIRKEPNIRKWIKEFIIENDNRVESEEFLLEIEQRSLLIKADPVRTMEEFKFKRKEAYVDAGVDYYVAIEALWEKVIEGRPEKADALQLKRAQIKIEIPKPQV